MKMISLIKIVIQSIIYIIKLTKMSCYECGKYDHKRDRCPARRAKIRCHEYQQFGHYKNDCPVIKQRELEQRQHEHDQKILQREIDDKNWLRTNLPDKNMTLVNKEELKTAITRVITTRFKIETKSAGFINLCCYNNQLTSYDDSPLGRYLKDISLENFFSFVELKGDFISLSYNVSDNSLSGMIYDLAKNNIVEKINVEVERENEYMLCDKRVMRTWRWSTDLRDYVYEEHKELICKEYDKFKNGNDAHDSHIAGNINFIYQ